MRPCQDSPPISPQHQDWMLGVVEVSREVWTTRPKCQGWVRTGSVLCTPGNGGCTCAPGNGGGTVLCAPGNGVVILIPPWTGANRSGNSVDRTAPRFSLPLWAVSCCGSLVASAASTPLDLRGRRREPRRRLRPDDEAKREVSPAAWLNQPLAEPARGLASLGLNALSLNQPMAEPALG